MSTFNCGAVITVGPGREENLTLTLKYLLPTSGLQAVVIVCDGPDVHPPTLPEGVPMSCVSLPEKHRPGMEQPRNVGVRHLNELYPHLTHAWFLDSDILVPNDALAHYRVAAARNDEAILIGPYEWMPPGQRTPMPELKNDGRWAMFNERSADIHVGDLGVALGNFGGNLVWPILEFIRVGGFHPDLHHGRCEDGELGLRAASLRVPMILVPEARGWHLWHEVNGDLVRERNARDVPLLNSWHPWIEDQGVLLTDQDGARFEFVCPQCGEQVNTLEMWAHMSSHTAEPAPPELILPDGLDEMPGQPWEVELIDRQHAAIQDHIRALVEQENIGIVDLADYTGMNPHWLQDQLEQAQRRSHR